MLDDGSTDPPRVAYAIGRRVGSAVDRNRIRRRLRGAVAGCRDDLVPGGAYLFDAERAVLTVAFTDLSAAVAVPGGAHQGVAVVTVPLSTQHETPAVEPTFFARVLMLPIRAWRLVSVHSASPLPIPPVLLAVRPRRTDAPRRPARRLARRAAGGAMPPVAPGRLRPRPGTERTFDSRPSSDVTEES